MLTELRNALAILVAAEARIHDLVDPTIIQTHVAAVAKANAAAIEAVLEKVNVIEAQVGELVTLLTQTATELTPVVPVVEPLAVTITPPAAPAAPAADSAP